MKVRFTGDYASDRGSWSEGAVVELDDELAAWLERDVPGIIEDSDAGAEEEPITEAGLRKLSRAELDALASDRFGIDAEAHPNIDSLIAAMLAGEADSDDDSDEEEEDAVDETEAEPEAEEAERKQAGRQNRQKTAPAQDRGADA